ncbi:MAG TPA: NUDIX hydrolase, partial [Streptosporangiaceae bacterium]
MTDQPGLTAGQAAIRLPGHMAVRAREVLSGRMPPVTPRNAATVMLLRPGGGAGDAAVASSAPGMQVYMLRRTSSMAFAPGAYVFPGGSVDERDAHTGVGWAGPSAAEWGEALDAPPELARALVCAAVRETFEESGVLLAGPASDTVVTDTSGGDWEADRRALLSGSVSLAELLHRRQLVLRSDLLSPWSRWITPVTEERRYDTRFFAAALPGGQRARHVGEEADKTAWVAPAEALTAASRQRISLLPPTAVTLAELRDCGQVSAVLTARRPIVALMPEVVLDHDDAWLTLPAG